MRRKFDQYCPMAHALSLIGERWSLLIVRDLLHGPKRYTDLAHGLPGLGTNILAARLSRSTPSPAGAREHSALRRPRTSCIRNGA